MFLSKLLHESLDILEELEGGFGVVLGRLAGVDQESLNHADE